MLALAAVLHILSSFPAAYFVYRVTFDIRWMGILNFMTIFVIIGIGADNVFIVYDALVQSRHLKSEREKFGRWSTHPS